MTDETEKYLETMFSVCENESELKHILKKAETPVSGWMPILIQRLFKEDTSEKALILVKQLVTKYDSKFSVHISEAVKAVATTTPQNLQFISNDVMQLWMFQCCCTSQINVHTNLLEAFESLIEVNDRSVRPAISHMTGIWKQQRDQPGNPTTSSIVCIRCATLFLHAINIVGDAALEIGKQMGTSHLLFDMIRSEEDPLLQLSVLDLFPQVFDQRKIPDATREWMSQDELTTIIFKLLEDPIVGGASMQYLGLVAKFDDPNIVRTLFQHILAVGPTANESERLQIVHALSNLAQASTEILELVLSDKELRKCWWDLSRTSVPKLQAAILSSIAETLGVPQNTNSSVLLRMYAAIGQDNAADDSTTAWMLKKYAHSPMPELRIASYTLWISLTQIPGGCTLLATSSGFMDLIISGEREASFDGRVAKFELLTMFHQHSKGFLASEIGKKVDEQLRLGPHGMKAQRWDVATE